MSYAVKDVFFKEKLEVTRMALGVFFRSLEWKSMWRLDSLGKSEGADIQAAEDYAVA